AGARIILNEELLLSRVGERLPVDAFAGGEIGKDVVFLLVGDFLHVVGAGDDHGAERGGGPLREVDKVRRVIDEIGVDGQSRSAGAGLLGRKKVTGGRDQSGGEQIETHEGVDGVQDAPAGSAGTLLLKMDQPEGKKRKQEAEARESYPQDFQDVQTRKQLEHGDLTQGCCMNFGAPQALLSDPASL